MVGDYKAINGTSVESIETASDELCRNPDDKDTINLQKAKARHDRFVNFLNNPGVVFADIKEIDACDGFRYTIDPNDLDDNGNPKLVVKGMYEGDRSLGL